MTTILAWLRSYRGRIIMLSITATMVLPWLFTLGHVKVAYRLALLFILINMILAVLIGRWLAKGHLPWWYSLCLPVLFGFMVWFRFADYNYWFMPIYWLITMLSLSKE
ncbi:hypothetical protein [Lacticaseibacillus kribbianus]|uniref:hypothetical protein n=1 Tax=Lacticaseibacillus kribbianus TaxID=2926292 RepID=UPI001CD76014|nr:hypothetical protein [Lacticaseibacillus kribbianus]